jgi:hypothetical protein
MKQNERLLVYAVTGFLAIVLLVAVLFGPNGTDAAAKVGGVDPAKMAGDGKTDGVRGLGEILGQNDASKGPSAPSAQKEPKSDGSNPANAGKPTGSAAGSVADVLTPADVLRPGQVSSQQPLVANERPLLAMDLVAQQLGPSRRDRSVRMVRAKSGDSLEMLVRRWCGARDPFLEEAKSLNEDLVVLRVGQEVCVPWVDDEVVLAAYEAQKPKMLVSAPAPAAAMGPAGATPDTPAVQPRPTFAEPGNLRGEAAKTTPAGVTTEYTVKAGDALWKIAERTYGKQNAGRMVPEIRKANPDLGETLKIGQKLLLPAK